MRTILFFAVLLIGISMTAHVRAAEDKSATGAPKFVLPAIGEKPAAPVFSPAQLAFVQSWIRQKAPECPVESSLAVAQDFLEDLQQREPDKLDRLLSPDFPARQFESMLLRSAGAKLAGPGLLTLREKIASRRVAAVLAQEGQGSIDAGASLAKLRDASDFQYRRLLDGRMEDDELLLLLKKPEASKALSLAAKPLPPAALSASEIISEFARHNQAGSATQRLHSYAVEGQLTTAKGQVQQMLLFKLRPDRFRMMLMTDGVTRYVLGADSDIFWRQVPGHPAEVAPGKKMGELRYMAEFVDPLFVRDGYEFELLPDGGADGHRYFRIAVKRPDGSHYVAWIEPGTYRQIGREDANQAIARYADFREVAGVTFAFREEITGADGHKAVLVIARITPNPGLITDFFRPVEESPLGFHQLEEFTRRQATASTLAISNK